MGKGGNFVLGVFDGRFNKINPNNFMPQLCQINRKVARAAAKIQNWICRWTFFNEGSHCGLRCANIPRRNIFVHGIKKSKWVRTKSTQNKFPYIFSRSSPPVGGLPCGYLRCVSTSSTTRAGTAKPSSQKTAQDVRTPIGQSLASGGSMKEQSTDCTLCWACF